MLVLVPFRMISLFCMISSTSLILAILYDWLLLISSSLVATYRGVFNKYYNLSIIRSFSQKQTAIHATCPLHYTFVSFFKAHSFIHSLWTP